VGVDSSNSEQSPVAGCNKLSVEYFTFIKRQIISVTFEVLSDIKG